MNQYKSFLPVRMWFMITKPKNLTSILYSRSLRGRTVDIRILTTGQTRSEWLVPQVVHQSVQVTHPVVPL